MCPGAVQRLQWVDVWSQPRWHTREWKNPHWILQRPHSQTCKSYLWRLNSCVWHHNCSAVNLFYISSFSVFKNFVLHKFLQKPSAASSLHWQMMTVMLRSALLLSLKYRQRAPPPLHPPRVLISSSGECKVAWISYNSLFSASSVTRKFSVVWGKHFLSVSWRSSVWVVYC